MCVDSCQTMIASSSLDWLPPPKPPPGISEGSTWKVPSPQGKHQPCVFFHRAHMDRHARVCAYKREPILFCWAPDFFIQQSSLVSIHAGTRTLPPFLLQGMPRPPCIVGRLSVVSAPPPPVDMEGVATLTHRPGWDGHSHSAENTPDTPQPAFPQRSQDGGTF